MFRVSHISCPFYDPMVLDCICRLCNYARKIQLAFFKYKFKKFYRDNYDKFSRFKI